jgi:hypothetical protein
MSKRDQRNSANYNQNNEGENQNRQAGKTKLIINLIILAFILGSLIASGVTFVLLKGDYLGSKNSTPSPTPSPIPTPTPLPTPSSVQPSPTPTESPNISPLPSTDSQTPSSPPSPTQDPGNTLTQALDLGVLRDTRTYNDFVGSVDLEDYYRFQLNSTSNVQLSLSSLSQYAYIELILDRNGNGQVDDGEVLNRRSGSSSASINTPLGAGNYIFRVYPSDRNDNTTYTLQISATEVPTNSKDPGNTVRESLDLGVLRDTRTYNDFVGSVDLEDYYRFQLNSTSNVQLSLSSLSQYTYIELILDRNGNGQVDDGEVLNRRSGSSSASINTPLGAGNYIFRVYPSDRNDNTTYTLEVVATEATTN